MSSFKEGGAEGFICPYCLVSFASSNKLQTHFIDFHSNEGGDASVDDDVVISGDQDSAGGGEPDALGHILRTVQLAKPSSCDVCGDIIWNEGASCQLCGISLHPKCSNQIVKICVTATSDQKDDVFSPARADAPPPAKGIITELVRRKVAKNRNRYVDDTFDLDLTYITERIIAMSFPGSGLESIYRNNVKDVAKMLKTKHQENYMIFNLSERSYDISRFNNQVLDFGWPDHLAPSLERLSTVCKSMKSWLDSDPNHVAVVHCKGGKGRTGCVIAAFMHYSEICQSPEAALDHFAMKRFYDDKLIGVTQPSQRRYVHYFADLLSGRIALQSAPIVLRHVIIHGVPNFDNKGGCRPFLKVYENMKLIHTSGLYVCPAEKERIKISLYGGLKLQGEILLKCFHKRHTGAEIIFRNQFHHAVVTDHRMVLTKQDLDEAFREKRFSENIKVELIFEQWTGQEHAALERSAEEKVNIRDSLLVEKSRDSLMVASLSADDKRNSYASFDGNYDTREIPNLIQFDGRDRSSTGDSFKMDPELIERVEAGEGELYTVVSKVNGAGSPVKHHNPPAGSPVKHHNPPAGSPVKHHNPPRSPVKHPPPLPQSKPSKSVPIPSGQPSRESSPYSHLNYTAASSAPPPREGHGRGGGGERKKIPPPKPQRPAHLTNGPYYSEIDEVREGVRQLNSRGNSPMADTSSVPPLSKYDEVPLEGRKLVLEPVTPRQSTSDNDMWMSVKWETEDRREIELHRSNSSGVLDVPDYTNLAEINTEHGIIAESPRRHSFSEGKGSDSPLAVNRVSRIPITGNLVNVSDDLYTVPPDDEDKDVYDIPPDADYVNYDAADMTHEYLNDKQLDEMIKDLPPPAARTDTGRPQPQQQRQQQQQFSGPLAFMNVFSDKFRNARPKQPSVIHSGAISTKEKNMPSFEVGGRDGKLQIGRGDYMAFSLDSWGGRKQPQPTHTPQQKNGARHVPPHDNQPTRTSPSSHDRPVPPKKPSPAQLRQSPPAAAPGGGRGKQLVPTAHSHSQIQQQLRPHKKLQSSRSQPLDATTHNNGSSNDSKPSHNPNRPKGTDQQNIKSRQPPPPRPAPYKKSTSFDSPAPTATTVSQVKQLMGHWYHSSITRDAAADMVKTMRPGEFIVRDSQTVHGGYALTIRVSEDLIREKRKLSRDIHITDEMCVTHFLIQPTTGGIKLQGWNECSFPTLADFIARHCVDKLCLPCVLRLPGGGGGGGGGGGPLHDFSGGGALRKRTDMDQALASGAACDLVFLGAVEVTTSGSDAIISAALHQLKALGIFNLTIVNFKASKSSITVTDTSNGILSKRNYPLSTITYCGMDPNDMRWDFPNLERSGGLLHLRNKPCFGIIHKPQDSTAYVCLMFAELDSAGPVANVVHYVRHILGISSRT